MFGVNLHQTRNYFKFVAKADPLPTRIWISVVMAFNAASTFRQIYVNWTHSVDEFNGSSELRLATLQGDTEVIYAAIIM